MAVGTALGVSVGAAVGSLMSTLALWMGISIATGVGVVALLDEAVHRQRTDRP